MPQVPPNVHVLASLPAADDVVTPLDTRRLVLADRRGRRLGESHRLEELGEVQHLSLPAVEAAH